MPFKRNKYLAKKIKADGITFDSLKEHTRYCQLKLLERSGHISELEIHPAYKFTINGQKVLIRSKGYPNGRHAGYKLDYRYRDNATGNLVYEDVKSEASRTEAYCLRKALMEVLFGIIITEI